MSEYPHALAIIVQGEAYELLATPDQATFILRSKSDFYAARLQGDDAIRFQADYDTIRAQQPHWAPDQTLAQLWDQGGYSWLAAQDGE